MSNVNIFIRNNDFKSIDVPYVDEKTLRKDLKNVVKTILKSDENYRFNAVLYSHAFTVGNLFEDSLEPCKIHYIHTLDYGIKKIIKAFSENKFAIFVFQFYYMDGERYVGNENIEVHLSLKLTREEKIEILKNKK